VIKLLSLLILSLFPFHVFSGITLEALEGCYETKLIDGRIPRYSYEWERNLSRIEIAPSSSFTTIEQGPLTHALIVLFTDANGMWTSYHPFVSFLETGAWSSYDTKLVYAVDQDLLLWDSWGRSKLVDHQVALQLEALPSGELKGHTVFTSVKRGISGERQFLLSKTFCP
jgi:hypothetical protein